MRDLFPIEASRVPASLAIAGSSEGFALVEAEAEPGKTRQKKFSITGYTGGLLRLEGWPFPVVVELEGMSVPRQQIPALYAHDRNAIVGHTSSIEKTQKRLYFTGILSGHSDTEQTVSAVAAREIVRMAANDFQWQASIGASPDKVQFVPAGESVKANGFNFDGPLYLVAKSTLAEISFVAIGADMNTSASVAAAALAKNSLGGLSMDFQTWLSAKGVDETAFSSLPKAAQDALTAQHASEKKPTVEPVKADDDPVKAMRIAASAEATRIAAVRAACQGCDDSTIEAKAIAEGWTAEKTELAVLRAARPKAPLGLVVTKPEVTNQVIEAAVVRTLKGDVSGYTPQVMEAADANFRQIGLQQMILMAAAQNGYSVGAGQRITQSNLRSVMEAAFIRASSSFSLPGILGNVANKQLLMGYMEEDDSWREISKVTSASTFHTRTYYRMLDDMEYEAIGADGEIKHGKLSSESYTAGLGTYAKMFALDRTSIINDDLGAFDDLRTRLGRGAKKKFNNVFWTEMLSDHANFFTAGRGNYITGSTTTLLTDGVGLGLGLKAFRQMKSPTADGAKRVNARPSILLVPPELEAAADKLFAGEKLNVGSSGGGDENIYRGKYRPVVNAWLSDSAFTGYSTTAWYLFRAANDMPMMTVSFLNGNETPIVESADADFNTLGIQFRGYHDFGADQAEYLCGVKSKGAA